METAAHAWSRYNQHLFHQQRRNCSVPYPKVDTVYQWSTTNHPGDDMFEDLFLDDMWMCHLLALCAMLTRHHRIQANKGISCYCLARDINVPQNLRGLLECGVQVDLDWDEKVEGTNNILLEAIIRYAGSVRTALWYEIKEDRSKVRCCLAGSLFLIADDVYGYDLESRINNLQMDMTSVELLLVNAHRQVQHVEDKVLKLFMEGGYLA